MSGRWLSIVGIGEDGRAGLSASAITLVEGAELVIGGQRHLDLFGQTRGERCVWSVPLDATLPKILERRGRPVAVLASGDPFWYGAGVTLARTIPIDEMLVVPAPSSLSLAASRMGWALQDTVTLGLNMRGLTPLIRRHLHDGRKILALSLNGDTPREVAELISQCGFGPSRLAILEALGGPRERIRSTTAQKFDLEAMGPLNIVAVDVIAGPDARPLPATPGLADDLFEHDGQITKREIRAMTLSSLAPKPGELLWDIGLGSGSVAIEWLLAHGANRAIGFEKNTERAARAARNAISLGVPHLEIRTGEVPAALSGSPSPDAIFIGGGVSGDGVLDMSWIALKPGGRMVVNAVTLEAQTALVTAAARLGGTLTRIVIERVAQVGTKTAWKPALPVVQWSAIKSKEAP